VSAHNGRVSGGVDSDWVTVDLLDETPAPVQAPPPRRRLGLVAAVVAAVVAALVLWPQPGAPAGDDARPTADQGVVDAQQPAPDDPRLLPWPGRGPWIGDEGFVEQATAVWQAAASGTDEGPGPDVHALWAGPVGDVAVAVLQSVGRDGRTRVAQVTESPLPTSVNPGPLLLSRVDAVDRVPPFVVLSYGGGLELAGVLDEPGSALLQVLPAPGLLTEGVELQRLQGSTFATVGMQDDGLSQPWVHTPWLSPGGPVVSAVRTRGAQPGMLATALVDPGRLLPATAPVQLVPPAWGRVRADLPTDYVDAQAALLSLGRSSGRVSILGSTQTPQGRASLVEVRPTGPGRPVVVTVGSGAGSEVVSPPRPSGRPDEVALGAARSLTGDTLVVAAGPPEATFIVVGADGEAVATGPRTTAVWLGRDVSVSEVSAQGYREDETWVGRTTLDLADL
jgi:hypothetical protein